MPARNAERTIGEALESVRVQHYSDFECLVVDDGSRDGTADIARRVCRSDSRFRLVAGETRGLVSALNLGVAQARGQWVARMDADDLMLKARLVQQLGALERSSLDGVGCHVRCFPRASLGPGRKKYERWLNSILNERDVRRERFVECPLAHPTWCMRRRLLLDAYRDVDGPEDYDVLLRLLEAGVRLGVVPRPLLLWRDHPARLSRIDARYDIARFVAVKARYLARGFLRGGSSYRLWGYGKTGRALATALATHGLSPTHIVELHPGRIGQRIRGAEVVSAEQLERLPLSRLVVSVAGAGPRNAIRAALREIGLIEEQHFVCAA